MATPLSGLPPAGSGSGSNSSGFVGLWGSQLTYAADSSGRDQDFPGTPTLQTPAGKAAVMNQSSSTSQAWPTMQEKNTAPPRQQQQQAVGYPQVQQHQQPQGGWAALPPPNGSNNVPGHLPAAHGSWGAAVAGKPSVAPGMQQQQPQQQQVPYGVQQPAAPWLTPQQQQQQQQQYPQPQPPQQQRHGGQPNGWSSDTNMGWTPLQQAQHSSDAMHGRMQQPSVLQGPQDIAASRPHPATQPWQQLAATASAAPAVAAAAAGAGLASPAAFAAAAAASGYDSALRPVVPERRAVHGVKVTSPMVLVGTRSSRGPDEYDWAPIHMSSMDCSVQCQINIAFVRMELHFTNPAAQGVAPARSKKALKHTPVVFHMPKTPDVTVTKIYTDRAEKAGHTYVTQVVEQQATRPGGSGGDEAAARRRQAEQEAVEMVLLSQSLAAIPPGEAVKVTVEYVQPLHYDAESNNCVLQLPTLVQGRCLREGLSVQDVVSCKLTVNTGLPEPPYVSCNYHSEEDFARHSDGDCVTYEISKAKPWPESELLFSYSVGSRADTRASMQVVPAAQQNTTECTYPGMDTYLLSIMPPGREEVAAERCPRDVVFLLDRSSVRTDDRRYMQSARTALLQCLDKMSLQDADRLTVVDFNSSQNAWWSSSLLPASPEHIDNCKAWLQRNVVAAGGGGNISSCLDRARALLTASPGAVRASSSGSSTVRMPTIIVMVDGVVEGERAICEMVEAWRPSASAEARIPIIQAGPGTQQPQPRQQQQQPRVFTFGVGECSQLFLKRLAAAGRGMCKIAVDLPSIKPAMEELLQAAGLPVLTDIQLTGMPHGKQYPRPIPDLCVGQPLVVTGFVPPGELRQGQACLVGQTTGGREWRLPVQVQAAGRADMQGSPVDQVAAYQELEFWATEAWRLGATDEGKRTEEYQLVHNRIVELSKQHSIPVKNFTELRSIEFKGGPQQFYYETPLDRRVRLASKLKRSTEVLGGAAVVGTAVIAGAALGIAAVATDFGDIMGGAADLAQGGCDGFLDMFMGCCY